MLLECSLEKDPERTAFGESSLKGACYGICSGRYHLVEELYRREVVEAECSGHIDITNPSTGEVIAESPLSTTAETNRAIAAAEEAFKTWRLTPASRRVAPLFKLAQLLRDNEEEVARS